MHDSGLGVALGPVAGRGLVPASRAPQTNRLDLTGAVLSVAVFTALTRRFQPARANLNKRTGLLVPVTIGLAAVAAGLMFFATRSATSGYGHYVLAMVTVSAGIGLAMSAATSGSMRELPPAQAGIGSAVNDTTRNMGSVLGVAVFGSISASVFTSQMTAAHLHVSSVGAAAAMASHIGGGSGAGLLRSASSAFVAGANHAVIAGAIAAIAGAVIAVRTR